MKYSSAYHIVFPEEDILTFLFSHCAFDDDVPVWINAEQPTSFLTIKDAKLFAGKIGYALRGYNVGTKAIGKDVVMTMVENQIMVAPTVFGILSAGGVLCPSAKTSTAVEVARQIDMSRPKVFICSAQTQKTALEAIAVSKLAQKPTLLVLSSSPGDLRDASNGDSVLDRGHLDWQRFTDLDKLETTTAFILFSSGTTGLPKGVKISHRNVVTNICQMRYFFDRIAYAAQRKGQYLRMPGVIQNSAPAGILVHSMMSLQTRLQVYLIQKYDFEALRTLLREEQLSVLFLTPSIYARFVQECHEEEFQGIRFALSGAAPLPLAVQQRFSDMMPDGVTLKPNWGMTETSTAATQFDPSEVDEEGSVGRLVPGLEMVIVAPDGQKQPFGMPGEIRLKGPNMTKEYFENPEATAQAFDQEGWFRTGDIGLISASGKLFIKGRLKELLKYKAHQISPVELEAILAGCPSVADVGIGSVSDGLGNDLPRAYVVVTDNAALKAEEVHEYVNSRVSSYKRLRGGVKFVEEIPRNTNGKIARNILQAWSKADSAERRSSKI